MPRKNKAVCSKGKKGQIGSIFAHAWTLSLEAWADTYGKVSVGYFAMDAIALSFVA